MLEYLIRCWAGLANVSKGIYFTPTLDTNIPRRIIVIKMVHTKLATVLYMGFFYGFFVYIYGKYFLLKIKSY
jgi:hypothetical protein